MHPWQELLRTQCTLVFCTFSLYSGLLWIHGGIRPFQSSWFLFSISSTPNTAALANPLSSLHGPPLVPLFFMWPLWPVLCDSTARGPHAQVAMAMTLKGPSQKHTHTHSSIDTLAYTLRQRRAIDILLYGGWRGVLGVCVCVCVFAVMWWGVVGVENTRTGGRSPGDRGPQSVTEATESLSGSIHSIHVCSPTQSAPNQLSAFLNGFQWQP